MKNNSYISVKKSSKDGRKYENLVCHLTLENGKVVTFQIKEAFFNRKFHSLLVCNLPVEDKDNETK